MTFTILLSVTCAIKRSSSDALSAEPSGSMKSLLPKEERTCEKIGNARFQGSRADCQSRYSSGMPLCRICPRQGIARSTLDSKSGTEIHLGDVRDLHVSADGSSLANRSFRHHKDGLPSPVFHSQRCILLQLSDQPTGIVYSLELVYTKQNYALCARAASGGTPSLRKAIFAAILALEASATAFAGAVTHGL
jgi:hypothetical protein